MKKHRPTTACSLAQRKLNQAKRALARLHDEPGAVEAAKWLGAGARFAEDGIDRAREGRCQSALTAAGNAWLQFGVAADKLGIAPHVARAMWDRARRKAR